MDGDDHDERDRWVIENSMWHFQVPSYTNYAYGMLSLWGVCVSGLSNHRLNFDFYRLLTSTIMFS